MFISVELHLSLCCPFFISQHREFLLALIVHHLHASSLLIFQDSSEYIKWQKDLIVDCSWNPQAFATQTLTP